MERELAGLADGAAEEEEADSGGDGEAADRGLRGEGGERAGLEDAVAAVVEEQGAGGVVEPEEAEEEADVADARGDEGFFRGGGGGRFVEPEADEQIRSEADEFPADEEKQEAVGDEEAEHRGGEETEEAEELLGAVVEGVNQQRPHTSVLLNAHRATDGVLQQRGSKLDALGPMVDGQPGQNHHWNGIGHVASHATGCSLM